MSINRISVYYIIALSLCITPLLASCENKSDVRNIDKKETVIYKDSYSKDTQYSRLAGNNESNTLNNSQSYASKSVSDDYPLAEVTESENGSSAAKMFKNKVRCKLTKPIPANNLVDFLPDNIKGTEKIAPNNGTMNYGDYYWTTASTDYAFPNRGSLTIILTDYGDLKYIPEDDLKFYNKIPVEDGKVSTKIIYQKFKGYKLWSEETRSGTVNILVGNRFTVRIDAVNLPKNMPPIEDYLKYFKLKKLIATGKKQPKYK